MKNSERTRVVASSRSKHAIRILSIILLLGAGSLVQAAEWGWRVESVTNPTTGAQATGPTTVFPTKEGALAAARAMFPPNSSGIDYEWKIVSMTTTAVTYQYIYEPKEPDYSPWTYTLHKEGPFGWGPVGGGPYASEGDALAAMEAYRTTGLLPGGPPCQPPNLVPVVEDWRNQFEGDSPYGNTHELKTWNIEWTVCRGDPRRVQIRRQRTITCSSEGARLYRLTSNAPFCWQGNSGQGDRMMSAFITGNLLECPSGFSSPAALVGDPCNAGNGDFLITETDYASQKLRFTRTYHSAASQGSAMGWGWSHSYGGRVVPPRNSNTAAVGLLRHGGSHDDLVNSSGTYRSTAGSIVSGTVSGSNFVAKLRDGSQEKYQWGTGNLLELIDPAGVVTNSTIQRAVVSRR